MTALAHPAGFAERARIGESSYARLLAYVDAVCLLLVGGLAAAAQLASPSPPPIQSQEPAVTAPAAP